VVNLLQDLTSACTRFVGQRRKKPGRTTLVKRNLQADFG